MTTLVHPHAHPHDEHDHEHPHDHDAAAPAADEGRQHHGPSRDGSVVLDIGGDVGAVVLHVPAALAGVEIDIVGIGPGTTTTHSLVRPRVLPGGTVHAAVYPGLPRGRYRLIGPAGFPPVEVEVPGGAVAEIDWCTAPADDTEQHRGSAGRPAPEQEASLATGPTQPTLHDEGRSA